VRDPNIIDTNRPIIVLEDIVYEGDLDTIIGTWTTIKGEPISGATITSGLFFNDNPLAGKGFLNNTNENGNYILTFNYTTLEPGTYVWKITFDKSGYQIWDDLTIEVTVQPHTYKILIGVLPELIQGKQYSISATVEYNNTDSSSSLSLNEITDRRDKEVEGVEVEFVVSLLYENGDEKDITLSAITNQNGVAIINISPGFTKGLDRIVSITATISSEGGFNYAAFENFDGTFPKILPPDPTLVDQIVSAITENIIFLPMLIAVVLGATLVALIYNRRRLERIRKINNNIKSAFVEMTALNSIQSIIIQTSTKLTVYEETIGVESSLDTNLVGGMVTAFSSFLNEVGKHEQFGYEMMEREGVSITAHKGQYSNFIVISNDKLPIIMLSQIPLVQSQIEREFRENFRNTSRGVIKLKKNQIYPIFDKIGFKVVLRSSLIFNEGNIRKLLRQSSLSRALKQNIRLLHDFPKSEYGKNTEFDIKEIMSYFNSKGISERISSRIIILAYQFKIIEPKGGL
ncbi:MAG: carboxypeptidase-like regulatory domain-containing protein, partial [Candidatus Hodarchaeales archaeon]